MLALVHIPIVVLAALGFIASAAVNLSFWLGRPLLPEFHNYLFSGIFVVHIPTVLVMIAMSQRHQQARSWKELLRGTPAWVAPVLYVVAAYAGVNFFLGFFGLFDVSGDNFFRIGSSHAMAFYAAGFAVNLAAFLRRGEPAPAPCARGHTMPPEASFCPQCGAARSAENRDRDA
jgi:hypothetical protein